MAIEFHCPHCDHLLRTSDDKAGMSAKCPACSQSIWVPYASQTAGATAATPPPGPPTPPPPPPAETEDDEDEVEFVASRPRPPKRRSRRRILSCPVCGEENHVRAEDCSACGYQFQPDDRDRGPTGWIPPRFETGEIFSAAWEIYTKQLGILIGCTLLTWLIVAAALAVCAVPIVGIALALQGDAPLAIIPGVLIALPLVIAVAVALTVGWTTVFLNAARGNEVAIGDLFYGFGEGRSLVFPTFVVGLCVGLLTLIGFVLCFVPGLIVSWTAWPAIYYVIDRRLTAGDALGQTYEGAKADFGNVLLVGLIAWGVGLAAGFIPYLGIILQIFAIPFCQLIYAVGYLRFTQQRTAVDP